jgi:hypothetical protein
VSSSLAGCDADHRALSRKNAKGSENKGSENRRPEKMSIYDGIGIAMLTPIESTVRVTISHSDNEPIASEAATTSISRDEATGAELAFRSKPAAPGDRIMAEILQGAGESPATPKISQESPAILGRRWAR